MRETGRDGFQSRIIRKLKYTFPGCLVLKNDPFYIQGVPDLLVLNGNRWAALEIKGSRKADHRPNQEWYVNVMNAMSYAAIIFPENEDRIFDELQHALESDR